MNTPNPIFAILEKVPLLKDLTEEFKMKRTTLLIRRIDNWIPHAMVFLYAICSNNTISNSVNHYLSLTEKVFIEMPIPDNLYSKEEYEIFHNKLMLIFSDVGKTVEERTKVLFDSIKRNRVLMELN